MRKEYDSTNARRRGSRKPRPTRVARSTADPEDGDFPPLTKAQIRELNRRIADGEDRARYLIVSQLDDRFALYYNVGEDVYAMNDPTYATLFKRRRAALAINDLLGPNTRVVPCRVTRGGRLIKSSIAKPAARRRKGRE